VSLCVVGDFAWDVLIRTNNDLLKGGDSFGEVMLTPGGSAANVAVWARRCGTTVHFVGKIGRDRFGLLAREDLEREGVVHHLVETDAHLTGSVAVFVDTTGERSMVSGRGADFFLIPSELPKLVVAGARHLHLTGWSFFTDPPRSAARTAAEMARRAGATISLDPASFQMIDEMGVPQFLSWVRDLGVSVFLPNHEEGRILTGLDDPREIAASLAETFPDALVVLKLDAQGALVLEGGVATEIPPATHTVLDATGAGDSFAGAFLARWLAGDGAVESARYATRIAAWVIGHLGARPAPDERLRSLVAAR
jgi:ribokinase